MSVPEKIRHLSQLSYQTEWRTKTYEIKGWKFTFKEPGSGIARKARIASRIWHPQIPEFTLDFDVLTAYLLPHCTVSAVAPDGKILELTPEEWKEFWLGKYDKKDELIKEPIFPDSVVKQVTLEAVTPLLMTQKEYDDFLRTLREKTEKDSQQTSPSADS